ncbi:hypothetical protein SAMN05192588_0934 [Nonlabens sp. Hel1_33_55]|uniref:hypothetical protein n=1 Tax=Nonlabens sp. Hel1_33_55 TaxID=1336802 RepID=UPI000875AB0E|nr:hypothetical protein [Nonlabens sp. Hel1_33_55]SCY05910.1 hypothetical protein SAMN05192588_0934 [Nonlabens sp. Hel1_33_55]
MTQLDDQQIESLYKFTRQHFVEHYDLQTELVDHMAHGIEQQWSDHPNLSFEQARDREFKKFGVFGFMDVVEERQKALSKKYMKIVWSHFLQYMQVPRIIGFLTVIGLFAYLLKIVSFSESLFLGSIVSVMAVYILALMIMRKKLKRKKEEKRWMFQDMLFNQGAMGGIALIPLHVFNILNGTAGISSVSMFWLIVISILVCSMYLFLYIMTIEIPKHAQYYLEQTYPEYKLS